MKLHSYAEELVEMPQIISEAKVLALRVEDRRVGAITLLEDFERHNKMLDHESVDCILLERAVQTQHENVYN